MTCIAPRASRYSCSFVYFKFDDVEYERVSCTKVKLVAVSALRRPTSERESDEMTLRPSSKDDATTDDASKMMPPRTTPLNNDAAGRDLVCAH